MSLGDSIHGRIIDLSSGGVRISIEHQCRENEPVNIDLSFDAAPATHYALTGHARRASAHELSIEFDPLPVEVARVLVDELVAASEHDGVPHMILVDATSPTRTAIAASFREHGWLVTEVSTPLEAIRNIIGERFSPSVIAIADTLPESVAEELRSFLAAEHPEAHMIAIGESATERDPAGSWLSNSDARQDLDLRVGRIVVSHRARVRRSD